MQLKQVGHGLIFTEARGWEVGALLYNSLHICNCVKYFNGEKSPLKSYHKVMPTPPAGIQFGLGKMTQPE